MTRVQLNDLASEIIGAAIEVHKNTGPGLLESVYEYCLVNELETRNIKVESQVKLPIFYKGRKLSNGERISSRFGDIYFVLSFLLKEEVLLIL